MIIEKIILRNFKRFVLNKINEFIYTPEKRIQIILGTNGSGKSSLLHELSTLPADLTNDYFDNGFKEITVRHNNSKYILTSGIRGKKHSFNLDGEELNQGGTKKVQLILIEEHFHYTPIIHDVLTSKKTFTGMSTSERKSWFSNISTIDFTYALNVYNKLKTNLRDINGTLRIINSRLIELEKEIIPKSEVEYLLRIKSELNNYIEDILTNYINVDELKDNTSKLNTLGSSLQSLLKEKIDLPYLEKKKLELELTVTSLNNSLDELLEERSNLTNIVNDSDIQQLQEERKEIKEELEEIKKTIILDVNFKELHSFLTYRKIDITTILSELSNYEYIESNPINIRSNERLYNKQKQKLEELENKLSTFTNKQNELDLLSKEEDTVCPKCSHRWKLNFDSSLYKANKSTIDKLIYDLDRYTKYNDELGDSLILSKEKRDFEDRLDNIMDTSIGKFIYKCVNKTKLTLFQIVEILNTYITDWLMIEDLELQLKNIDSKIDLVNKHNQSGFLDKKIQLSKNLDNIYKKLEETKTSLLKVTEDLNRGNKIVKLNNQLKRELFLYSDYIKNKDNIALNKIKKYTVKEFRKEIEKIDLKLNEITILDAKIKDNTELLETQVKRKEVLIKLVKAISPDEGLIASSISAYLNNFTDHMNYIIDKTWSYNMTIKPATMEDDKDLDYKFPVKIDGNSMKDVSFTSTGMKEIINLAFKLMSMSKLNLISFPLILDEFGTNMDAKHRTKAYEVIESDITSKSEQIFIVSHYETTYGRFTNADLVVLSKSNIDLANDIAYNKVIKIK